MGEARPSTHQPPLLVAAVARRGDEVLVVRQYGPDGPDTTWALPGGRCEPGELVLEALRREVMEETGLHVGQVTTLAYCAQLDNPTPHHRDPYEIPAPGTTATVLAFEVTVADDTLIVADPDGFVNRAEWVPAAKAARLLEQHPFVFTGLPAASRVVAPPSAPPQIWQLRRDASGADRVCSGPDSLTDLH
ncbi:NUDIX domain-containing protein [Streptomyces sp. NPDC001093]|uniref:NUDIX hydrolase n=1 Tax=Streptomyces sp. NPDC001093 TaxID=3154376 RepID=UPI0033223A8E